MLLWLGAVVLYMDAALVECIHILVLDLNAASGVRDQFVVQGIAMAS